MKSTAPTQNLAAEQGDLVPRLKRGDQTVLRDILQTYGGLVMWKLKQAFCPAFKEPDLEEIVVDALYRVWESRDTYESERGSLLTWFLRIARNVAIDYRKHGWRRAQANECPVPLDELHLADRRSASEEPEEAAKPSPARQDLLKILDDLDDKDRTIILAYARSYEGSSWTGPLVEELGMNAGAIRTRAHRILNQIRRQMQDRGHGEEDLPAGIKTR